MRRSTLWALSLSLTMVVLLVAAVLLDDPPNLPVRRW